MKKLIVTMIVIAGFALTTEAQPRAIGGRLGFNLEASYQHYLGDKGYLQLDGGFISYGLGIQAVGTYNWIFATPQWGRYGKWEWFAGAGAGAGYKWWSWDKFAFIGAAGNVGLSFTFPFNLQLSIDYRPVLGIAIGKQRVTPAYLGLLDTSVSVRYAF